MFYYFSWLQSTSVFRFFFSFKTNQFKMKLKCLSSAIASHFLKIHLSEIFYIITSLQLRANEFLNLDAILEGVMHKLVVRPLRDHLYRLFVEEYTRSGAIERLAQAISLARHCPPHELGVRAKIEPPSTSAMSAVKGYLARLQRADSPLEKLENLLAGISAIFNSVSLTVELFL